MAAKGKTLADSSSEAEVNSIEAFLSMRPRQDEPGDEAALGKTLADSSYVPSRPSRVSGGVSVDLSAYKMHLT